MANNDDMLTWWFTKLLPIQISHSSSRKNIEIEVDLNFLQCNLQNRSYSFQQEYVWSQNLHRNDTVQNVELDADNNRSLHMEVPYVEWADNLKSNFREGRKKVMFFYFASSYQAKSIQAKPRIETGVAFNDCLVASSISIRGSLLVNWCHPDPGCVWKVGHGAHSLPPVCDANSVN